MQSDEKLSRWASGWCFCLLYREAGGSERDGELTTSLRVVRAGMAKEIKFLNCGI